MMLCLLAQEWPQLAQVPKVFSWQPRRGIFYVYCFGTAFPNILQKNDILRHGDCSHFRCCLNPPPPQVQCFWSRCVLLLLMFVANSSSRFSPVQEYGHYLVERERECLCTSPTHIAKNSDLHETQLSFQGSKFCADSGGRR